jgi:predicted RNA-binding protein YlxR (DUF448 family)
MCAACRERGNKSDFVRITKNGIDVTGKAQGRGAYLHKKPDCIKTAAKKRSLDRALRCKIPEEVYQELGNMDFNE